MSVDKKLMLFSYTHRDSATRYVYNNYNVSKFVLRAMGVIKVSNRKRDLQGHSRALAMVPFDRPHTISY